MRRAFTLIEVMVVLSILAIIAILAYNFFGSVSRDAQIIKHATQLHNDFKTISAAYHELGRQTGVYYNLNDGLERVEFKDKVITEGILREFPAPDIAWLKPDITCTLSARPGETYGFNQIDNAGPSGTDPFIFLYCISTEICEKYNELFTDLGTDISPGYTDYELHGSGTICSSATIADSENVAAWMIDIR